MLINDRSTIYATILLPEHRQQMTHIVRDWFQCKLAQLVATGQANCQMGHPIHILQANISCGRRGIEREREGVLVSNCFCQAQITMH